ncbi:MAG: hypothetical protein ACRCXA_13005 [Peptostreptococcaceae bacterium]
MKWLSFFKKKNKKILEAETEVLCKCVEFTIEKSVVITHSDSIIL